MATILSPTNQKVTQCRLVMNDIATSNNYYFFVGNFFTSNSVPDVIDSTNATDIDVYRNMIQGKRITSSDVSAMVPNLPYQTNMMYKAYDDQQLLFGNTFYTIVSSSSFYHVFKCLDNNFGANSTITPDFSVVANSNVSTFTTADNYVWKYMYSVSNSQYQKFASSSYFPVVPNTVIQSQATRGSFDVIKVDTAGQRYDNYLTGQFAGADLRVFGNNFLFQISSTTASTVNGFYSNCLLYITSGGGAGQYRTITDYICNGNGNFIVVDSALTTATNGSRYEMYPKVVVTGDGNQTTDVVARALVNSLASNSIYKVDIINSGAGFSYATANVLYNNTVPVTTPAVVRPIYPPRNGHGSDPASELGSHAITIAVSLVGSESNTILTTNDYRQIGIIKNPLFANVKINHTSANGTFLVGEQVLKISPLKLGVATVNTTSTTLTFTNSDIRTTLSNTDVLYLELQDQSSQQIAYINSFTNSTSLILASNAGFTNTMNVFLANSTANAYVLSVLDLNNFYVTNCVPTIVTGDTIVGVSSGKKITANTILRNDVTKGFGTFIQASKYLGTAVSGAFQLDEIVKQGTKYGYLHSVTTAGGVQTFYVGNTVGVFDVGGGSTITGNTSGAISTLTNKYGSELIPSSGIVVRLENIQSVNRTANTEAFKIKVEYN